MTPLVELGMWGVEEQRRRMTIMSRPHTTPEILHLSPAFLQFDLRSNRTSTSPQKARARRAGPSPNVPPAETVVALLLRGINAIDACPRFQG